MQKSETRRFLEEQFEKYERSKSEQKADAFVSELSGEGEPVDEYLQAPASYGSEWGEVFKSVPLEMRRFLHEREAKIAKIFDLLRDELQTKRFLDEEFSSKGCRHGFKSAKDWIEKLIFAEEMMEAHPRDTLCYLARAYGVDRDFPVRAERSTDVCEMKIDLLGEELRRLEERFDERERHYAAAAAAAQAAKKAKAAGFSPRGRAAAAEDEREMTTRQLLEKKFAELED